MKLLSLVAAIGLGLAASVGAQQYQQQQQQASTDEQQPPQKSTNAQQNTTDAAGPSMGHSSREQMKDTSQPERMKNGGTAGAGAATAKTNTATGKNRSTTVNKQDFKSRHSEVFSLGRHPREFFVQRFGANHVRVFSNTLFVFVDNCWVAVDADGFVFAERMICSGDPDFVEVE
jgi:hypothetical protein